jgi:streptomycin 6-kinase
VRLLGQRDAQTTLLLERIIPGTSLDDQDLAWEEKLQILGRLVARLHDDGPPPVSVPRLADHAAFWRPDLDDPGLVRELDALLRTGSEDVLLHGDLHPGNALRGPGGWTVIDPTAIRGDRHADIWALICPQAPVDDRIRDRVETYAAAAGLDAERAAAWARVRAAAECSDWLTPAVVARIS